LRWIENAHLIIGFNPMPRIILPSPAVASAALTDDKPNQQGFERDVQDASCRDHGDDLGVTRGPSPAAPARRTARLASTSKAALTRTCSLAARRISTVVSAAGASMSVTYPRSAGAD